MRRPRDVSRHLRPVPDDLPRRQLYVEPIRVSELVALPAEHLPGGEVRLAFQVTVKDAVGARCSDLAVEARVSGPARVAVGTAHTDAFGQAWFRTRGVPGTYRCDILDVAAGAIALERPADSEIVASTAATV